MIKIVQGSDKDLIVRLENGVSKDPYDFTGVSSIKACFEAKEGETVEKFYSQFTGDTDGINDLITNIPSTTGLLEGQSISGPGIPSGATIIKTPTSTMSPTPAGTIQISANTTAANIGATFTVGDISILGSPLIGKIKIHLNETDTMKMESGSKQDFEITIVKNGFTSTIQFPDSLEVVERIC